MNKNLYDILGVSSSASQEEINTTARRLLAALESSPSSSGLDVQLIAVKEAFQVLANPQTRGVYDRRMQMQAGTSRLSPLEDLRYPDEPEHSNAFWEAVKPMLMSGRVLVALSILIAVSIYSYYSQMHRKAVVTVVERAHMDARDKVELQELRQEMGGRATPEEMAEYEAKRLEDEKRLELTRQQQQFSSDIARYTAEQTQAEHEKALEREREKQQKIERERQEREWREQEMSPRSRPQIVQ